MNMVKADIFSGFLGAGKTTLIKKLIAEAYQGEKLVLIENEFGDIAIDGGFLQDAGVTINELNSGCICCSLVGDFHDALTQVIEQFSPDRILIEPSGVGKLSDIILAVQGVEGVEVNSATAVVDAAKCKMYIKNFGEFYNDQVSHAGAIVLSRTDGISAEKLETCLALLRERNAEAVIITTAWDQLDGRALREAVERTDTLEKALEALKQAHRDEDGEHHHHHHDHDHDGDGDHEHHHHHHDHDDDDDDDGHEHHHHHAHEGEHHHDHEEGEEHEHHHEHGHHHDHEHHHGHHHHHHGEHDADEIFTSWGVEMPKKYAEDELKAILAALDDEAAYGVVLRAKGIVDAADGGQWLHFDHVPGEAEVRRGPAGVTGRLCVIGSELKEDALKALFKV